VTHWHIITGEYPPQPGGVSDYTRRVACGLVAAGDRVDVWAPPVGQAADGPSHSDTERDGVTVRRLPDHFGLRSLRLLTGELDRQPAKRRLLVQYVPHAFGWKAANLPFCWWLRSRRRDSIWVMFHEVAFPFGRNHGMARNALAAVNRVMASIVASSAERAFVSIPGWQSMVQSMIGDGKDVEWLPVPSSIPVVRNPTASASVRTRYGGGRPLVGHFGTHGQAIRAMLHASIPSLVESTGANVLLIGRRSDETQRDLVSRHPLLDGHVHGTGVLPDDVVSMHVAACDVMLQPYPDGVSSRRTSAMVALSHGVPMVTTTGWLSESLWEESGAVELVDADHPERLADATAKLLESASRRNALGSRALSLYLSRFDMPHSIRILREADAVSRSPMPVRT
jgi:glycosyltransferase involved in cell wall biosynthesis